MSSQLVRIKEEIELLNKPRQIEVLKVFLSKDISATENKNGVFINLSIVTGEIIEEIEKKLGYFKEQDSTLEEMEIIKQEFQDSFFDTSNSSNGTNISTGIKTKSVKQTKKQNKDSSIQYAI